MSDRAGGIGLQRSQRMSAWTSATTTPLVAWVLVAAGIIYFAARAGAVGRGGEKVAFAVLAVAVLVELMRRVDPAWVLSGGIALTMFSGNWDALGVHAGVGPERVVLGAGIIALVLRLRPARDRPRLRLTAVHFMLAVAVAYVVVSAIVAGTIGRRTSETGMIDQYGLLPFLMFLVAPAAFRTERQRQILLGTIVAIGLYLSVTAIFEKLHLNALIVPRYITNPAVGIHWGRARGPFVEAVADGLAIYFCAVAAAIAYTLWRRPWQRAVAVVVIALAPIAILLTLERIAWLAPIIATPIALLQTARLRRLLIPAVVVGVLTILGMFAALPALQRQVEQRSNDQSSIYERENVDAAALRMIAARPILGFGWDRSDDRILPYFRLAHDIPLTGIGAGFHDIYLQYAVNLGLVGFVIWVLAGVAAFGSALTTRAPPELRPWQLGLLPALIAWLTVGVSTPASYVFTTVLLWTWAGIVYGPRGLWLEQPEASAARPADAGVHEPEPALT